MLSGLQESFSRIMRTMVKKKVKRWADSKPMSRRKKGSDVIKEESGDCT